MQKNAARGAKGWTSGSLANAMTPAGRGRLIADAWAAQHAVQGGMLSSMADDAAFQRRLIEIKLALALYRAENGAYPDTIADLPPGSLSTPFEELLDGSVIEDELEYVRSANGYHLRNVSAGVTEDLIDGESPVREPGPGRGRRAESFSNVRRNEGGSPVALGILGKKARCSAKG